MEGYSLIRFGGRFLGLSPNIVPYERQGQSSNPTPLVSQPLVPTTTAPGGPAFTLTVNGTGFVSGSVVQWNGAALTTQFVSASQLTATVPASHISLAGTASVTVSSPTPGGGVSNPELLSVTSARPAVALGATAGQGPVAATCLAVADFNGDGKPDISIPNLSDAVSVLLSNGDGTFQPTANYSTGSFPFCVATRDVNHDGKVDLAVTNTGDDTISVLLGNGDGTFQPHVDYAVGALGDTQSGIAVADFNGDGNVDLAVSNSFDGTVSILLGNGDGTFQPQIVVQAGAGPLAAGDFNGDGKLDLADAAGAGVTIWLGNGDGTFTQGAFVKAAGPVGLVAADLNGDGKLDLAAINGGSGLYVALGNGDGTFQAPVLYTTAGGQSSLAVADLNGDGKLDVAVNGGPLTSNGPYVVSALLGNGDGTFQPQVSEPSENVVQFLTAGDFNSDGMMDLATINGTLADVFLGTAAAFSPYIVNFGDQAGGTTSPPKP